ncbi:tRNA (adenosine(37)-N6)-threonylcarbamoyltransferase complex dimerization subunit type 1 TsaB [Commensalibacter oyaizuii]|uniref:tRNA (Adenosine(37)-N6)-threonylcarbamoyltransferase complex dimerization subunit type 1 TsaB n=1 Tax=Commensalibacter oyaizuii TaxID=3043873 RepID=A0ABT6Q5I5_9PROT|nr:tRNA (adenosine(37)-N6)-threonylcarbamoyltransferase complex dimerization subunit type 1 TsaB [Commensalibacter sp. TBRC 16381]MDI2091724.1 tRNA (adenosine(37)-N6)-threonylcarbamoyltransferase complex dimerization subunit type 1 TsaB [Commensalibacter sp. TBRC 16381]
MHKRNYQNILVINGASSSLDAPNFITVVRKEFENYTVFAEEKTTLKGGPERFPIFFQQFINKDSLRVNEIDLIAIIIGPGSFTGLRASIAFALGIQVGLACPVVALRRGEVVFPFLSENYKNKSVWHVTHARRGRIFIESNISNKVTAYNLSDIEYPATETYLIGEGAQSLSEFVPSHIKILSDLKESNAIMIAQVALQYYKEQKVTNELYPLYVDAPEAKLPQKGLRAAPQ